MASEFKKICRIDGKDIYTDGSLVRFNRSKSRPLEEHERWSQMTRGEKRLFRRAAFRAGFRSLANESLKQGTQTP